MSLVQRPIPYLFPLYLTALEPVIRTIFSSGAFSVSTVSSSISVGGLALVLPYLVPKPFTEGLSQQILKVLQAANMRAYRARDQHLAVSAWFFLVTPTFVRVFSLSRKADARHLETLGFDVTVPEIGSASIHLVGLVPTAIEERG